jgi:hypothetical protein
VDPELRGFKRIHLRAGETQSLHFTVPVADGKNKDMLSVGGGQPLQNSTGYYFMPLHLPSK